MNRASNNMHICRFRRQLLAAAGLGPLLLAVYFMGYWVRFDGHLDALRWSQFAATAAFVVGVKLVLFLRMRVFQTWGRFVTFHDLVVLCKASSFGSLLIILGDFAFYSSFQIPRTVVFLDWALTIFLVGGAQMVSRIVAERKLRGFTSRGKVPVLIVGANECGEALLRAIRRSPKLSYHVIGFVCETPATLGQHIAGVPVVGALEQTCRLAKKFSVSEVLIAAGELSGSQMRKLVKQGNRCGVKFHVVPSYERLLHGAVDLRPRPVSIADLLGRESVELNIEQLHRWIDDRVLLVTGSAGSIGSEICRQLLQFSPRKMVLVDIWENGQFHLERELRRLAPQVEIKVCIGDVGDMARMDSILRSHQPSIVFHAAAYKHVPLMEENPSEAVKNITLATRSLADLSEQCGVESFVMISTDKAVNPTSVMGACKRVAELYVQARAAVARCRFVTVRFGNVLDSSGSVVPVFREQIERGGPVTVTHPDMQRYFMTIPEASQLVIQAGAMGRGGEIFVLDMGQPVKIVDLATDMIRLSGLEVDKDIDIQFVGLRPGEKLYEELNIDGEERVPTTHPKIVVANSVRCDASKIRKSLDQLSKLADAPSEIIRAEIQQIVPEYGCPVSETPRRKSA
jgi:FlaA1/EpsC-like NDP-sugar epimerase